MGLLLLALILAGAVLGPRLVAADPLRQDLSRALAPPGWDEPLGRDHLGRSVTARLVHGTRHSLGIAAASVTVAVAVGGALGIAAAMLGGAAGGAVRLLVDTALALPPFLTALLIAGTLAPGPLGLGLVIAGTTWVEPCRVGLLAAMRARGAQHVEAARLAGLPFWSIAARLVAPALPGPLASVAGLMFGQAVLTIAGLGFLGLGLRPPAPEWGAMIVDALPYAEEAPLLVAAPAAAIVAAVAALFLVTGPGAAELTGLAAAEPAVAGSAVAEPAAGPAVSGPARTAP